MPKNNLPISVNPISLPEPSTPQNERSVSMSNALTRGAQGLNLAQKRVVSLALGCFDSKVAKYSYLVQNTGGWEVILHAQDYADIYGLDINTAYDQLQDGGRSLLKTTWKAAIRGQNQKTKVREGSWFIMAEYGEGEGHIKLVFSPYIAEHLLALRTQFTSYKIKQIAQLNMQFGSMNVWNLGKCLCNHGVLQLKNFRCQWMLLKVPVKILEISEKESLNPQLKSFRLKTI